MRVRATVVLVSLVLFAALVGAWPAAVGAASPPDACRLLKRSEVAKAFRTSVSRMGHNTGLCVWDLLGGIGAKNGGSVSLELDTGAGAAANFEGFTAAGTTVTGLGERAFYGPDASSGINVLKGDNYVRISATFGLLGKHPPESRLHRELVVLARRAIERLR
jgi:hypothetical protein